MGPETGRNITTYFVSVQYFIGIIIVQVYHLYKKILTSLKRHNYE